MLLRTAADDRPYHLGPFPLETLPRVDAVDAEDASVTAAGESPAPQGARMMPVPNDNSPQAVDRKAALAALAMMETPLQAKARKARGGAAPLHYIPTPPRNEAVAGKGIDLSKYGGVR
jgi:hypothetical protein